MKNKIFISVFLVSLCIFYSFKDMTSFNESKQMAVPLSYQQDSFIIGVMHDSRDSNYSYLKDTLSLNIWHKYTAPPYWGWPELFSNSILSNDRLDTPVFRYVSDIRERIQLNETKGLKTLIDRPKFQYLSFGQRSDYQCEKAEKVDPDYWFYTYHNSTDNGTTIKDVQDSIKGSGEYVKQCLYNRSNPGANAQMLFDSLKGNLEQVNNFWPNPWIGDALYDWYVMPRIRIDSAFANNPFNQEIEVCKIITTNRVGDSLSQILKVKHFKKDTTGIESVYHGNYLDLFYPYDLDPITNLVIPSDSNWFNNDPQYGINDTHSKVDFKVFWYDKCDMWIDRIRVENEPAHDMMTLHSQEIEEWIRGEVQDIAMAEVNAGNNSPYKFYVEEFEMNHMPCIGYLNKKIIYYSQGRFSLMVNYNHDLFKVFIPNSYDTLFTATQIKKYLIDSADLKEIFTECYGLEGWDDTIHGGGRESYVPNTLYNGPDYLPDQGLLVYKTTPQNYDYWLQEHFDNYKIKGNEYTHIFKLSDEISKIADIPFLNLAQAHMWRSPGHILKEPSNEELSLMNNLAVSYGARGIIYFSWTSDNENFDLTKIYSRGITNTDDSPRRLNVYGQNKWEGVKKINATLKKWGPYLMSFDNISRESYIYRIADERNEMYANTFISKLKAFPAFEFAPDPIPDLDNSIPETNTDAYLQAAFFQKEIPTDQSKYFMIVNRRCSPFINYSSADNLGGRRLVTMRMNPDHLPGFTNWKFYNLENGDTSITFSKYDSTGNIFVGDFLPGEGKLFRLAPVMQEGGTLVADEDVIGNFDCNGEVNNNGKNITLKPGTTINFANSDARIIMNGGNFKSGINTGDNTAPVNLQGKDTLWKGIVLQDCPSVEMYKTYFKDISPYEMDSTYAVDLVNCLYSKIDGCSFLADQDLNTGGIRANYTFIGEYPVDAYFLNNTFQMSNENIPALSFISSGGITVPLIIDGNTFTSDEGNSANAIFLCNVSGGAIKNNTITDYKTGVFMLSSSMDFYNNVIDGSSDNSIGIKGASQSALGLGSSGNYFTAGMNNISSEGSSGKCIYLHKTSFDMYKDENIFNLKNYNSNQSYHLSGTFPDYQPNTTLMTGVENSYQLPSK
jgi:hypothetical protein